MQSTFKLIIMKKHHFILACSFIFLLLFYNESIGINLAFFGLILTGFICYFFQDRFTERSHLVLVVTTVLSCLAFAWYGDFVSFLALVLSLIFLQFKTQETELKIIQVFPLVFINGFASLARAFMFSDWLPEKKLHNNTLKKLIAYFLIPMFFLVLFFAVYSFGSDHFSSLFTDYTLDLNFYSLVFTSLLGFYISFTFWNYWIPDAFYEYNSKLTHEFSEEARNTNEETFSFLDLDFERKSGEITLLLLNVMLLVFIGTYNYEQFFEAIKASNLSSDTHERVNAVIFSSIMAVGVILFYFKNGFNFDEKAGNLKKLAKIWIVLNGVLIVSTIIKNSEYVSFFGLTYKRLGVYAFLMLAIVGLVFTFYKITKQKTNAYLFNQLVWCSYATLLFCSFINWGNLITNYNIAVNKGVDPVFLSSLNFNDENRREYFLKNNLAGRSQEVLREKEIVENQQTSFLSKPLYYSFLQKRK